MMGNLEREVRSRKLPKPENHGSIPPKQQTAEWCGHTKLPASPDHRTPPICKLLIPCQEIAGEAARSKTESLQLTHTQFLCYVHLSALSAVY